MNSSSRRNRAISSALAGSLAHKAPGPVVADEYAKQAESALVTSAISQQYLKTATFAEIRLIREDYGEAAKLYREAIIMDPEANGLHQDSLAEAPLGVSGHYEPASQRRSK